VLTPSPEHQRFLEHIGRTFYAESTKIIPDEELTLRVFITRKTMHQIFTGKWLAKYPITVRIVPKEKPPQLVNLSQREEPMFVSVVPKGKAS
jgi:hypothetical protein